MARPNKQGLDYFPMDVTTDDKFELIEAKHGIIGFAVIIKLYQKIYKDGYFISWNEEMLLIFKKSINVDINDINVIINDAIKYNIFDKTLFEKYKILSSTGIQKRFLAACDRRKSVDLYKNLIIVDTKNVNANINWINDDISTQSKVKKSKKKEDNTEFYPFSEFWNDYDKKVDSKKCQGKWDKVSDDDRKKIKEYLPEYKKSTPEIRFRKNPSTFLNNECWNDPISSKSKSDTETLGYGESYIDGKRMFNRIIEIPTGTRPCPNNLFHWSASKKDWIYGN